MRRAYRWLPVLAIVLILIAAACGLRPGPASLASTPEPGFKRSYITPAATELILSETSPVQAQLVVEGELSDPCSRLGWYVKPGDDQGRIELALYADQPVDTVCTQAAAPYSEIIPLGTFGRGSYGVFLNDELVQEFVLP
jgi:hypothetical protein